MKLIADGKITIYDCPADLKRIIKKTLTLANPQYQMAAAMVKKDRSKRSMLYALKPEIKYYKEDGDKLIVGRGLAFSLQRFFNVKGLKYELEVDRVSCKAEEELPEKIVPRDYQVGRDEIVLKHKQGILKLGTAWGKTPFAFKLIERTQLKTLIVCCKAELNELSKYKNDFNKFYGKEIGIIQGKNCNVKDVTVSTASTLAGLPESKLKELGLQFGLVIVDECFTGETEILTENGFQKFKELEKNIKVAQWDNGRISFIKPLRHIKKRHNGEMILFKVKHKIGIPMTPGHNQIFINNNDKSVFKKRIKDACLNTLYSIPTSGTSIEKERKLTSLERLYIAVQADGSIHTKCLNHVTVSFTFTKQRKIDRIIKIMKDAGVEYREVKHGKRHKIRLMVKMPKGTTKDITNHIGYPMGVNKAKDVIDEMVEWDGYKRKSRYLYSSKDKKQADFYAQVAVLAGHTCYQSVSKDSRKKTYSDIHRLFITLDKNKKGMQQCKKSSFYFKGNVYCVEVPSGAIVIRHKGFTFVSGNCHAGMSEKRLKAFQYFKPERFYGMTGTPGRANGQGEAMKFYYGDILIDEKLPQDLPEVHVYKTNCEAWGSEYYEMEEAVCNDCDRNYAISLIIENLVKQGRKILFLTKRINHGKYIKELIDISGIHSYAFSSRDPIETRNELTQALREESKDFDVLLGSFSLFGTGFDLPILDTVILGMSIKVDNGGYDATLVQAIGRCLRLHDQKNKPLIIDLDDNKNKIMHRHHLSRLKVYRREGYNIVNL